jgi:hypothetical protein
MKKQHKYYIGYKKAEKQQLTFEKGSEIGFHNTKVTIGKNQSKS